MTNKRCRLIVIAASFVTMPGLANAQPALVDHGLASDSVIMGLIVSSVYSQLGPQLARAALNPHQVSPWRVVLPDTTGRWASFLAHFWTSSRGRRALSTDSTTSVLRIESIGMHGDTLHVRFYVGSAFRCGNVWKAAGTFYTALSVRHGKSWEPRRTEPTDYEDSAPC
jgi:hypothetical protein